MLDKESFTLEELLDEEEIIQECKGLNSRLINLYGSVTHFFWHFLDLFFTFELERIVNCRFLDSLHNSKNIISV